jgi:hypothetical protein
MSTIPAAGASGQQLADPVAEAKRLVETASGTACTLRVLGGVAVALRCPSAQHAPLGRPYADIDLVAPRREARAVKDLLGSLGYHEDPAFNALHGATRLWFWDPANQRQLDVFLDVFEMCHRLDLSARVRLPGETLPLADLLLCKLQVVQTNEKDFKDIVALMTDHDLSDGEDGINLGYIAELTGRDWGLWRTITMVAERTGQYARALDGLASCDTVCARLENLRQALERSPKSRGWRLRARVGERVTWYEIPEEAEH